jgi:hypothetical protein
MQHSRETAGTDPRFTVTAWIDTYRVFTEIRPYKQLRGQSVPMGGVPLQGNPIPHQSRPQV